MSPYHRILTWWLLVKSRVHNSRDAVPNVVLHVGWTLRRTQYWTRCATHAHGIEANTCTLWRTHYMLIISERSTSISLINISQYTSRTMVRSIFMKPVEMVEQALGEHQDTPFLSLWRGLVYDPPYNPKTCTAEVVKFTSCSNSWYFFTIFLPFFGRKMELQPFAV